MAKHSPNKRGTTSTWWEINAFGGKDYPAAVVALENSGLLLATVNSPQKVFSAMARGNALIKGAVTVSSENTASKKLSANQIRLLQWRLVMSYAGFEIFVKSVVGRIEADTKGLNGTTLNHLFANLQLPALEAIDSPPQNKTLDRWLAESSEEGGFQTIADFLNLNNFDRMAYLAWLHGTAVTDHIQMCQLAKSIRNATAHGFLSPTKCQELRMTPAVEAIPKRLDEIRKAVLRKLGESRVL